MNAGQTCVAPDYLLVPRKLALPLAKLIGAAMRELYPTLADNPDYTAIVSPRHYARLQGMLVEAKAMGAKFVEPYVKQKLDPAARKLAPTMVLGATPAMQLMREEIFGPILPIVAYDDLDEAIAHIQQGERPLALYWFGEAPKERERLLRETHAGGVTINDCVWHIGQEEQPFGGVGASGQGAYHGAWGFRTFSKEKPIFHNPSLAATKLFYPPYGKVFDALVGGAQEGRLMQRRSLLKLGLGGSVLLLIAGGGAALWTPGLHDGRLTPTGRLALGALARALLDGSLPEGDAALQRQLDGFEATIAAFPPLVRQELQLLLSLTVNGLGRFGLIGAARPLHELPRTELQALLQRMRVSGLAIRQQAYFALRDLNCAAFVADPVSWTLMGYPGPQAIHEQHPRSDPRRPVALAGAWRGSRTLARTAGRRRGHRRQRRRRRHHRRDAQQGRPEGAAHRGRPAALEHRLQAARGRGLPAALPGKRRPQDRGQGDHILQGRCVGGSTTVNWTSSFRTPAATLQFWQQQLGLADFGPAAMQPWFEQAEARLNIEDWPTDPNPNNAVLGRGMAALGLPTGRIRRNVKGCWNLGSCGMGCPTNAKQSMLVTTIPTALDAGARLFVQTRVQQLQHDGRQVAALRCVPVGLDGSVASASACTVVAQHVVLAGGAINSPALLLRSQAPDPFAQTGRRTFLHPTLGSLAAFDERIEGWAGAPQTVYSDHFLEEFAIDGPLGYKLEAPPLHPLLLATTIPGFGADLRQQLLRFAHSQVLLVLLRDGFHPDSQGGRVRLKSDGSPELDYPLSGAVWEGARRGLLTMAEIQFAAGARTARPIHELAPDYRSWKEAQAAIAALPMAPLLTRVASAHVMGGCALSSHESRGVARPDGRHWQLQNLSIHDGSLFPTSIGANPQLSIYGLVARLSHGLAQRLAGKAVQLA